MKIVLQCLLLVRVMLLKVEFTEHFLSDDGGSLLIFRENKMNKQDFLQHIDELLELSLGTVTERDSLADIGSWDSLAILSFIAFVDQSFATTLSPLDIHNAKTIGDLVALLGNKISN